MICRGLFLLVWPSVPLYVMCLWAQIASLKCLKKYSSLVRDFYSNLNKTHI